MAIFNGGLLALAALGLACAALSYAVNGRLMPLYRRYGLARPNARSSHTTPTPQGGGLGVLAAMAIGLAACALLAPAAGLTTWTYGALATAAALLAATGWLDDIFELPVVPRLVAQFAAAGLGVQAAFAMAGASHASVLAELALPVLLVGLVWMINLTNFMDGIDGITVAEFVPISGALALLALVGVTPWANGLIGAALLGALAGFAPYNRHVARLFLGDVGSLPLGLIAGVLLLAVALAGHTGAALILPLYYLADATVTLLRRLANRENVTVAHRSHFYQQATKLGWSVPMVTRRIWLTNGGLAVLALASIAWPDWVGQVASLALAGWLAAWTMRAFARPPIGSW
jgi:UDP-N-acetylmuramyl pentapeptide phosphotransferase/UDP-N-acetylglucosamine-1-phosphate transferase